MLETSQQTSILAAIAVGTALTILGFFVREAISTSNNYRQGITLYQEQDYKGAAAAFRKVISRHPSNDSVRLLLGNALMLLDLPEEASEHFQQVTRRAPKDVQAHLGLGTALSKLDQRKEARAALEKARDLVKAQGNTQKAEQIEQLLQQISTSS